MIICIPWSKKRVAALRIFKFPYHNQSDGQRDILINMSAGDRFIANRTQFDWNHPYINLNSRLGDRPKFFFPILESGVDWIRFNATKCRLMRQRIKSVYWTRNSLYLTVSLHIHTQLLQCLSCLNYGHIIRECHSPPRCRNCAGGHNSLKCTNEEAKERSICANCIRSNQQKETKYDFNHRATNDNCPYKMVFMREIEQRHNDTSDQEEYWKQAIQENTTKYVKSIDICCNQ